MGRSQPNCPECGSSRVLRIVYGYPSPEMFERAERGEISLGGCLVGPGMPTWECRKCGARWGRLGEDDAS